MIEYTFAGKNGSTYTISLLTQEIAARHAGALKGLLDSIKGTTSSNELITSTKHRDRSFLHKWGLSYLCRDKTGIIVGVVLSYFHFADQDNPFDSVYLHRLAISQKHRKNHVAFNLLKFAINEYFSQQPWLNYVSVQVTTKPLNLAATKLYEKLGFYNFGVREYQNKLDSICVLNSIKWHQRFNISIVPKKRTNYFSNPRAKSLSELDLPPVFYLSTGSPEKREQLSWLLSLYNFQAKVYSPPVDLVEPQVDKIGTDSEQLLVSHPLKQIARFIGNSDTPLLIEDTMLFIEMFNKEFDDSPELPGLDTKRWWRQLGNEGILQLMKNSNKRRAKYVSQIGCYLGNGRYVYGRGELEGEIARNVQQEENPELEFPMTNRLFFHQIFVPDEFSRTLAQLNGQEFTRCDYRRKAIENMLAKVKKEAIDSPLQMSLVF